MSTTGLLFLGIFFGCMALAITRHPIYGLVMYVLVFYLHPPSRWWGEDLPDLRWAFLAAAVTAVAVFRLPPNPARPSWFANPAARILIAYVAWVWLQTFWALDRESHVFLGVLLTKFLVVFFLIYRIVDSSERITTILLAHVAGCLYLAWLAQSTEYTGRLNGVGGPGIDDANSLSMQLATGVMAAAMLLFQEKGWRRWFCVLAAPVLLNAMVMTGSRGGFLGLAAGGLVLWYLRPAFNRRLFYTLAGLGVVGFLAVASGSFWERMSTIKVAARGASEEVEESALSRWKIMEFQVQMAREHPMGVGHRGTVVLSTEYLDPRWLSRQGGRSSHNTFLTAWGEQGIPGAVIYFSFWGWIGLTALRARRAARVASVPQLQSQLPALVGGLAVVMASGMFTDYVRAEIQIWLVALLTVLYGLASGRQDAAVQARSKLIGPTEMGQSRPPS